MGSLSPADLTWRISIGTAGVSFVAMAAAGGYFLYRRRDFEYRLLGWLFVATLIGTALTRINLVWHGLAALPARMETTSALNGLLSLCMAVVAVRMLPSALRMTSRKELARVNQALREEIDARRRAEQHTRDLIASERLAGEAKTGAYFEAASQAIIAVSREGRIGLLNRRTEEMFGYSREELIGQPLELLVPASHRGLHAEHRAGYFRDPRVRSMGADMELSGQRKDGTQFPVEIGLSYVESEEGTLALGLVSDITERRTAEAAIARKNAEIKASEAQLRSYLEAASQAILAVSAAGKIVLVNRAGEDMFGYRREELLGAEIEMLLPQRFRAVHTSQRAGFAANPRVRPAGAGLDLRGRRKDGTEFPAEVGLSYVETTDGNLALGLVTDITERKRAADELAAAVDGLRRSNTELEQFAYLASHDLQEPLRMITSYLNLLARRCRGKLDEDGEEFLSYAVDGAERMKQLIRDFLAVSRISTQALSREPADAAEIVANSLQNLNAAIEESGATVHLDPLPSIPADPGLLAQVFQNLVGNAIKFRGDRAPEIRISAMERGADWVFSVSDNGIGIESRHAERIFGIFERLHESTEYSGSGIGLAVCKKIVERHGGRIWFESEFGTGSVFRFSIPAKAEKPMEKAAKNSGR
jgi:PAS domain S-box-containing protein